MARSKPAVGGTALAEKKSSGAIVNIQEILKKQAEAMASQVAPASGITIRTTQDKQFILPDGRKSAGPIDVVILDFNTMHTYYEGPFDPKNIVPPGCFAIGSNPLLMKPSKNSPNKQADECAGCPMNQFGSDGDGKACKNARVLAVLPPDADAETPIWLLKTSPTAIKGFDAYVSSVTRQFGIPPIGLVTSIAFDDSVTYAKLTFGDPRPNENVADMVARLDEAKQLLLQEPDVSNYQPPKKSARAVGRR